MSRRILLGAGGMALVGLGMAQAQALRTRTHTATRAQDLSLQTASRRISGNQVEIRVAGGRRTVISNGIPDHSVGSFPNSGNPHSIAAQSYRFEMTTDPRLTGSFQDAGRTLFGVGLNGVPFDPGAAEFWQGERSSGWIYEALGGAVALGLDANYGHVQPTGAYHYHGLPVGLMQARGWSTSAPSPLIGYAADGFPVYAMMAEVGGRLTEMTTSWRIRSGNRPGGSQPGGSYDGTFVQDYVYVEGAGRLDRANGAWVETADYPGGTYAYFLTRSFPVIPRYFAGTPDASFAKDAGGQGGGLFSQNRPARRG